jgi:predicted aspartyl protease
MPGRRLTILLLLVGGLLAAPSCRAAGAPEPPAEAVIGDLPFQNGDEPNRILLDLAPEGGTPFVMMLDTGASQSILTPLMARKLGVTVRRQKSSPYRRATRLGRDLQFWIDTQSSDTGSKTGWEYGLLGGDFLDHFVVEIDFPRRRVRFLDPKKYQVPEGVDAPDERVLPVKIVGSRVAVPIELGGATLQLALDTGAPDTMILSGPAARKAGIDVDSLPDFGTAGSVLGPVEQRIYEATDLRLAGFSFAPIPVIVAPKGWYNQGLGNDSLLGYDVLAQFVVRIDYPRRRLWLRRATERVTLFGAEYLPSSEVGAMLIPYAKSFYLVRVEPGGPAARFGLREGDAIVADADEPLVVGEVAERIRAGQELAVRRREDGTWRQLSLPAAKPTAKE